ncbi:OmpA family protein [Streptomyces sp. KLOTTS4A1]|uniref:OmpA family protein n=1 Tax=Streptomyces sp. KLOTTS4A1 TaxID=3390996 RepID=UPI0039F521DB
MSRTRHAATLTAAAFLATATLTIAPAQAADALINPPASTNAAPPAEVDPSSPNLKLAPGATLAPSRILDIKSVVEDLSGAERREDTNTKIKFALQAEVLFGKDSSKLNPEARSRIRAIADEIKNQGATNVRVFGFTDNLGSYAHGKKLSKQRADSVHRELSKSLGPDVTYEIRGYSEDYPIADNATEEGRKKNRRVEISFQRGDSPGPPS